MFKGQDRLSFKEKGDCKCILNLVRNPDDTTDTGCITLTFVDDREETFFHRIQIDEVPLMSLSNSMSTMSMSSSVSSNLSDQGKTPCHGTLNNFIIKFILDAIQLLEMNDLFNHI